MLVSMTGYGRASASKGDIACIVEVRAVNNRFLKINVRVPDAFGGLELRVDCLIREMIRRGTVSANVRLEGMAATARYRINEDLLRKLLREVKGVVGESAIPSVTGALLSLPDMVEPTTASADESEVWPIVEQALGDALKACQKMRRAEGAAMGRELSLLAEEADSLTTAIARRSEVSVKEYHERLCERVRSLFAGQNIPLETTDLVREAALLAERFDVAEELARLRSHFSQLKDAVVSDESSGRKLDFLAQELNREANTIGSKANDLEIANAVVELKTRIERIRELVQNVE